LTKKTFRAGFVSIETMQKNSVAIMQPQLKNLMRTYEEMLQAVIRYIDKHGKTQAVIDKIETMLPDAWSANIIADALDEIASR
jgi:hypothetical protein